MPFKKGQGGRPRGAPNKTTLEERDYWRLFFDSEDYRVNAKTRMLEGKAPHLEGFLLAKTYGKPTEHIALSDGKGGPVRIVHEHRTS